MGWGGVGWGGVGGVEVSGVEGSGVEWWVGMCVRGGWGDGVGWASSTL